METQLIQPDCDDPADEFERRLDQLAREARHHPNKPVDDDRLVAMLSRKSQSLAEQVGGGA